jgi:Co/Zn/Cd efflux system component
MHHTMTDHLTECRNRLAPSSRGRERRARLVVALTAGMMLAELIVGYLTRSMALTADGWHMATHAGRARALRRRLLVRAHAGTRSAVLVRDGRS